MFLYQTAISAALVLNYSLILSRRPLGFVSFMDFDEVEVSVLVYRTDESKYCDVYICGSVHHQSIHNVMANGQLCWP
jgi:hypothetical protein